MINQKEICTIFAETLYLDESEVKMESKLIDDLGAESIDFLDLTFQLESKYDIKIPRGSILTLAKNGLSDEEFAVSHKLTAEGAKRLRTSHLSLAADKIREGMMIEEIPSSFTVQTFAKLVEYHLNTKDAGPALVVNQ